LHLATAIGASALSQVLGSTYLIPPQGILSPVSSTTAPIPTSDQTAVTTVYWTPYNGNVCPIYNGSSFVTTTSSQLSCSLTAGAQASGGIYDVYKFLNSGSVTLGFGPSWSAGTGGSVTAGSCARGTSTGGAALTVVSGILVNAAAMTLNNGATTYSVAANQGTYLGSVYINSTAGQYNCHVSYGQSRTWGLWNAYNRRPLYIKAGDSTASWTSNNATGVHAANTNSANSLTIFSGLPDETVDLAYSSRASATVTTGLVIIAQVGVGFNSTSVNSGKLSNYTLDNGTGGNILINTSLNASNYLNPPWLGINTITALEFTQSATVTVTFYGGEDDMLLSAKYRG
jgi:hypothetical protein